MAEEMFPGLAAEIDAAPTTMAAHGGFEMVGFTGVGSVVSGVLGALRAAGIPWMKLFALVSKIVPLVIEDVQAGKSFTEIVGHVLSLIISGGL